MVATLAGIEPIVIDRGAQENGSNVEIGPKSSELDGTIARFIGDRTSSQ